MLRPSARQKVTSSRRLSRLSLGTIGSDIHLRQGDVHTPNGEVVSRPQSENEEIATVVDVDTGDLVSQFDGLVDVLLLQLADAAGTVRLLQERHEAEIYELHEASCHELPPARNELHRSQDPAMFQAGDQSAAVSEAMKIRPMRSLESSTSEAFTVGFSQPWETKGSIASCLSVAESEALVLSTGEQSQPFEAMKMRPVRSLESSTSEAMKMRPMRSLESSFSEAATMSMGAMGSTETIASNPPSALPPKVVTFHESVSRAYFNIPGGSVSAENSPTNVPTKPSIFQEMHEYPLQGTGGLPETGEDEFLVDIDHIDTLVDIDRGNMVFDRYKSEEEEIEEEDDLPVMFSTPMNPVNSRAEGTASLLSKRFSATSSKSRMTRIMSDTGPYQLQEVWAPSRRSSKELTGKPFAARLSKMSMLSTETKTPLIMACILQNSSGISAAVTRDAFFLDRLVVGPSSNILIIWSIMECYLLSYDALSIPASVFDPPNTIFYLLMMWVSIVFWTSDVFFSCFRGFITKSGDLEMRFVKVLREYVKTQFSLDCALLIIEYVNFFFDKTSADFSQMALFLRFLRFTRLLKVGKFQRLFRAVLQRSRSNVSLALFSMFKVMSATMLLNHWSACGWYMLGDSVKNSSTWISVSGTGTRDFYYRYALCLQWSFAQMGFGTVEIYATNSLECFYSAGVTIMCVMMLAALLASTMQGMSKLQDLNKSRRQQEEVLRSFMNAYRVSWPLRNRVWSFLKTDTKTNQMEEEFVGEKQVLFIRSLPKRMQLQLRAEAYVPVTTAHPFFGTYAISQANKHAMHMLIEQQAIVARSLDAEHELFAADNLATHMYFVVKGVLKYDQGTHHFRAPTSVTNISQTCVLRNMSVDEDAQTMDLWAGSWLCEPALWLKWKHMGDSSAKTHCELVTIESAIFQAIMGEHLQEAKRYAQKYLDYSHLNDRAMSDAFADMMALKAMANEVFEPPLFFDIEDCVPQISGNRNEWHPLKRKWQKVWCTLWTEAHLYNRSAMIQTMTLDMKNDAILAYQTLFAYNMEKSSDFKWATPEEQRLHDQRVLFLKRLYVSFAICKVKFSVDNNGQVFNDWCYPQASVLAHGGRVLVRLIGVSWKEFVNFLLFGDSTAWSWENRSVPTPLYPRRAATHGVRLNHETLELTEMKLKGTSAIGRHHMGMDLPLGGIGNPTPLCKGTQLFVGPSGCPYKKTRLKGDTEYLPHIQHGHLYVRWDDFGSTTVQKVIVGDERIRPTLRSDRSTFRSSLPIAQGDEEQDERDASEVWTVPPPKTQERKTGTTSQAIQQEDDARAVSSIDSRAIKSADVRGVNSDAVGERANSKMRPILSVGSAISRSSIFKSGPSLPSSSAAGSRRTSARAPHLHSHSSQSQLPPVHNFGKLEDLEYILSQFGCQDLFHSVGERLFHHTAVMNELILKRDKDTGSFACHGLLLQLLIQVGNGVDSKMLMQVAAAAEPSRTGLALGPQPSCSNVVQSNTGMMSAFLGGTDARGIFSNKTQSIMPSMFQRPKGAGQLSPAGMNEVLEQSFFKDTTTRMLTILCRTDQSWLSSLRDYLKDVIGLDVDACDNFMAAISDQSDESCSFKCKEMPTVCHHHKIDLCDHVALEYDVLRVRVHLKDDSYTAYGPLLQNSPLQYAEYDTDLSGFAGKQEMMPGTQGVIVREFQWMGMSQLMDSGIAQRPAEATRLSFVQETQHINTLLVGIEASAPLREDLFGHAHTVEGKTKSVSAFGKRKWRDYKISGQEVPGEMGAVRMMVNESKFQMLKGVCKALNFCSPSDRYKTSDEQEWEKEFFRQVLAQGNDGVERFLERHLKIPKRTSTTWLPNFVPSWESVYDTDEFYAASDFLGSTPPGGSQLPRSLS